MKFDKDNQFQRLVIAALFGMVEAEGLSPHEAFEVLDEIKNNTFHALSEIGKESKQGRRS